MMLSYHALLSHKLILLPSHFNAQTIILRGIMTASQHGVLLAMAHACHVSSILLNQDGIKETNR